MSSPRGSYKQSITAVTPEDGSKVTAGCGCFEALLDTPMRAARALVIERFEREYVSRLLASCNQNVAEAARRSGADRATLFRIIRRGHLRER